MESIILELHKVGVIKIGNFKLKSGAESPLYCDFRILISYPKLMDKITDLLINEMKIDENTCVCGVPYGGIPYASIISLKTSIRSLMMRKEVKTYGTGNVIEGIYNNRDTVYLIEDVTTTGASAVKFADSLILEGLKVNILTILDRRMNRTENIKHVFTIEQIISTLLKNKLCDKSLYSIFMHDKKIYTNTKAIELNNLMEKKKSNLCIASDCTTSDDLISLIHKVGSSICLLKTHSDMIIDWSTDTEIMINKLKAQYDFMWMEDRKFGDIASTCLKQLKKFKILPDLVTVHSIAGKDSIEQLSKHVGVVVINEMSTEGNLCTLQYQKNTYDMCIDLDIVGFVGQIGKRNPKFIHFTPGVNNSLKGDGIGQQYQDVETKIAFGTDVIIVGRGIYESVDPTKSAEEYQKLGWDMYNKYINVVQPIHNGVDISLYDEVDISSKIGNICMDSCIYNASGVWCTSDVELDSLFVSESGAVMSKSCTILPRIGNVYPRVHYGDNISINSTGLANNGIDFYMNYVFEQETNGKSCTTVHNLKPYIMSIAGSAKELELMIDSLSTKSVDAIELNFSCPNLDGQQIAYNLEYTKMLIDKIYHKIPIPWGIKMPPFFEPNAIKEMANLLNSYPISFITCCNSLGNCMIISESEDNPVIAPRDGLGGVGGGKVMKSVALSNVYQFRKYLSKSINVIGCGGINSGKDVYDYLLVGANCVQIGTSLGIEGPSIFRRLNKELKTVMTEKGYCCINDIKKL